MTQHPADAEGISTDPDHENQANQTDGPQQTFQTLIPLIVIKSSLLKQAKLHFNSDTLWASA
jgi:hypothetical protein